MMLGAAFGVAESVEVDGDFIRVSFSPKNAMFKSKIEGKAERKLIEEVGRQLYGRQLTLAVSVGAETKAESSAKPKETATDKEQPDTHPAVRALVDKFRGEILEVVKPDS
jgi:chromosomal replication initiation ATPase DnaA